MTNLPETLWVLATEMWVLQAANSRKAHLATVAVTGELEHDPPIIGHLVREVWLVR